MFSRALAPALATVLFAVTAFSQGTQNAPSAKASAGKDTKVQSVEDIHDVPAIPDVKQSGLISAGDTPDYSREDEIVEKESIEQRVYADGTGDTTSTSAVHVLTEAGVRNEGVFRVAYSAGDADMQIVYLRVRKPDGTVVESSPADAQDTATPVTEAAPMYSDIRIKDLPVKGLTPGDTLEVQVKTHVKRALGPGQFWAAWDFPADHVSKDFQLIVRVPDGKYFQVISRTSQPTVTTEAGEKVYHWHASQLKPTQSEADKKAAADARKKDADKKDKQAKKDKADADVEITTFRSWDEVGAWYAGLERDRAAVTPEVKAKADELVQGKTADEDRIRALYSYVSTQYRYIGVELGVGRYQPHAAATVMDNRYGDCKDKHTLLAALLAAEGHKTDAALIRPEHKLESDYPAPSQFDHVITAVDLNGRLMWMDSTAETAPFGLLMPGLRDEDALLIAPGGESRLVKTPAGTPFALHSEWTATGTLSRDGEYKGHFDISFRDDSESIFRGAFRRVGRAQWDQLMNSAFHAGGMTGDVSHVEVSDPGDLSKPFEIHLDYTRKESDWSAMQMAALLPSWTFSPNRESDKPDEPFHISDEGEHTFRSSVTLPEGFSAQPPLASRYSASFVDYSSVSTLNKNVLETVVRVNVRPEKTDPSKWDDYLHWERQVEADEETKTAILRPGEKPAAEIANNPEAQRLISEGYAALQKGDLDTGQQDLDDAAAVNPQQEWLHADRAIYDSMTGRYDEGIEEYRQELQLYPRKARSAAAYASDLLRHKQPEAAIRMYRVALEFSPSDPQLLGGLGYVLIDRGRSAEAVTLLEKSGKDENAPVSLKILLARAYSASGRAQEAVPLLAAIMKTSEDQGELNDAAYFASLADVLLPEAQAASGKSLDKLSEAEEKVNLSNVTQQDLTRVSQISNGWDTYGWIVFQQGRTKEAESYVRAAWILRQAAEVGEHLGEILQKEGRKDEAVKTLRLAIAAGRNDLTEETRKKAESHLRELGVEPAASPAAPSAPSLQHPEVSARGDMAELHAELSRMRTIQVGSHVKEYGSAEFFVLLKSDGIEDVQFISGKDEMRDTVAGLKSADFKQPFPAGSKARLVRRGIVTCSAGQAECTAVLTPVDLARAQ